MPTFYDSTATLQPEVLPSDVVNETVVATPPTSSPATPAAVAASPPAGATEEDLTPAAPAQTPAAAPPAPPVAMWDAQYGQECSLDLSQATGLLFCAPGLVGPSWGLGTRPVWGCSRGVRVTGTHIPWRGARAQECAFCAYTPSFRPCNARGPSRTCRVGRPDAEIGRLPDTLHVHHRSQHVCVPCRAVPTCALPRAHATCHRSAATLPHRRVQLRSTARS